MQSSSNLSEPEQIVVFRQSALGDVIMTQPVVEQIKEQYPEAEVVWVASPGVMPLIEGSAETGIKILAEDKPRGIRDRRALAEKLAGRRRTWMLCLQSTMRSNLTYPFIYAERKIGWDTRRGKNLQSWFTHERIDYRNEHLLDGFLSFLPKLGLSVKEPKWNFQHTPSDMAKVEGWLGGDGPWLAVNPSASKEERNWPIEEMARVLKSLKRDGVRIVLTGGRGQAEINRAKSLEELVAPDLNLCGATDLKGLAALLSRVSGLLSPDTGPVHIARAVGTPVIGLYGVVSAKLTGPYGCQEFCVDRWEEGVVEFLKKDPSEVDWHTRVHHPDVMKLIPSGEVEKQCRKALSLEEGP